MRFAQNIREEEADLYIYGGIGDAIDGDAIAQEINWLKQMGVKTLNIRINSGGGSINNGFSVIGAMMNSGCRTRTYNDGVALSMGAMILVSGDEVNVADYSLTMIHNPSFGGVKLDEMEEGKDKEVLTKYRNSLSSILQKRMKTDKEAVDKLLAEESWFDAYEAVDAGIADSIFETGKKLEQQAKERKIAAEIICEAVMNEYKPIKNNMKELQGHFNLTADASEADILAKVKSVEAEAAKAEKMQGDLTELQAKYEESQDSLTSAKTELDAKDEAIKALNAEKEAKDEELRTKESEIVDMLLDEACGLGKIKDSAKDSLRETFKGNIDGLRTTLKAVNPERVDIKNQLQKDGIKNPKDEWGYKEYSKNAPKALDEIRVTNLELFNKLGKKSYGDDWKEVKA